MLLHGPGDTYYLRASAVAGDLVTESIDNIVWMKCDRATVGFTPDRGLFSKTNNTFGADFSRFGWSDGVSCFEVRAFGSNLVRMVLSRFPFAAVIRTAVFIFASNLAFVPPFGGQFAVASAVE